MKEEDNESTNQMGLPRRSKQSKMRECQSEGVLVGVRECRTELREGSVGLRERECRTKLREVEEMRDYRIRVRL